MDLFGPGLSRVRVRVHSDRTGQIQQRPTTLAQQTHVFAVGLSAKLTVPVADLPAPTRTSARRPRPNRLATGRLAHIQPSLSILHRTVGPPLNPPPPPPLSRLHRVAGTGAALPTTAPRRAHSLARAPAPTGTPADCTPATTITVIRPQLVPPPLPSTHRAPFDASRPIVDPGIDMNQQQMNMGGPVGGQPTNAGTPNSGGTGASSADSIKRLNTAIYDHLLRSNLYEVARVFIKHVDVETKLKDSPSQRANQPNGTDDGMDGDYKDRPDDLPVPIHYGDGPFLADWWLTFWDILQGHRGKGGRPATLNYISAQRQANKARTMMGAMDPNALQNMRGSFNGAVMPNMNGNMAMSSDLKRAAMANQRNLTPHQMAQVQARNQQALQQNQQATQMERQGSQLEMNGARSGSPGSGDAPSPKRQRLEGGGMQPMNQGRPGPPGQMTGQVGLPNTVPDHVLQHTQELLRQKGLDPSTMTHQQLQHLAQQPANHQSKSIETYKQSMQQSMSAQLDQAANSNMNKGMPPNLGMVPAGPQGSPMGQVPVDSGTGEFYATPNGARMVNGNVPANGMQNGNQAGGNHALQDYQMQLMLLEQQNKKRLLMARQEQDSMTHPGGPGGVNGQFAPGGGMSPQNGRAGDPSPNPNDMQRGTPKLNKPGMSPNGELVGRNSPAPNMAIDPSQIPPHVRQQIMQNGGMRPPSSHPMGQMPADQMRMMQATNGQMMPNGWQQGQPPQGMMPGQQPGPGGPPGPAPPNMTPRQGNPQMPPPPPPPPVNGAGGTQPSSPAPAPAPPTPNQGNKAKPGTKKEAAKKGVGPTGCSPISTLISTCTDESSQGNKKTTNAAESEQPPTPTPATPITPMNPKSFNNAQPLPNGQPGPPNGVVGQPGLNLPQNGGPPDMNQTPFGNLDASEQFGGMGMDFAGMDGNDVLDNFDFDSFLNTQNDDTLGGLDTNFMFSDAGLEAVGEMGN
nr:transcriptional activator soma [Quercus suber]